MPQSEGVHVVLTGPVAGRIPVDHPAFEDGIVDVTPGVLEVGTQEEAQAVADAIERHLVRLGTHPVQLADRALARDSKVAKARGVRLPDGLLDTHKKQKQELAERTGEEV